MSRSAKDAERPAQGPAGAAHDGVGRQEGHREGEDGRAGRHHDAVPQVDEVVVQDQTEALAGAEAGDDDPLHQYKDDHQPDQTAQGTQRVGTAQAGETARSCGGRYCGRLRHAGLGIGLRVWESADITHLPAGFARGRTRASRGPVRQAVPFHRG